MWVSEGKEAEGAGISYHADKLLQGGNECYITGTRFKVIAMKKKVKILLYTILVWVAITSIIQRFKCSSLTETELFKRIPDSFILNWQTCES